MSHRRTEETELILVLWAAIKGVQQFVNTADGAAQQHFDRRELLRQYQEGTQPKVPTTPQPTQESALLVLKLWLSIENGLGGIPEIPNGTKLLMAANCLPFLNRTGFSLPLFGHQPFMIWEHQQLYRLVTSTFLHSDLKHLVANLGSLVQSGSWLEAKSGVTKFAASVTSLGLAASFLDALYSRISYQRLGDKQGYFLQTSVGASGLCFGLQVSSFICNFFTCRVISSNPMHTVLLYQVICQCWQQESSRQTFFNMPQHYQIHVECMWGVTGGGRLYTARCRQCDEPDRHSSSLLLLVKSGGHPGSVIM
ncbi:TPA: hypothetical protein ACH3X2_002573 [Trebouxia sp. C0005]